jgi:type VI secretion system secreted protein VgrG
MPINTNISVHIDGEQVGRFSKLVIDQKSHTHHRFSIILPLGMEFVGQAVDKSKSYIGKPIKIAVESNDLKTEAPLAFNGIITESQLVRTQGSSGAIIINGYSPTIAMEGTPNTKSFTDKSLSDIVQIITGKYPQKELKPTIKIQNDTALPYTVQYDESDFGFLSRMAQKKGQWFYFNGEELLFGKPKSKKFDLEYGRSLHTFNIEMRAKALGFEYIGYDPTDPKIQKAKSKEANYQPEGFAKSAFDSSQKLFPDSSTFLYNHPLAEGNAKTHLADRVATQLHAIGADLVTAKGESDETGIRIGDIVNINESSFSLTGKSQDGMKEQNFGSYIITNITHICDESGSYHNIFDAVPDGVLAPPYGNIHNCPKAEIQQATVISNNDPKGMGRIKVQFPWQKDDGVNTPWIRMSNPHAGKGKGIYFIPEEKEEVLVGFEGGNAEKPFVIGAMYNGNETSGFKSPKNDKKVIQTRSGTNIMFDDAKGSITITDKSGANTIVLNGTDTISISSANKIAVSSNHISFSGAESVSIDSKKVTLSGSESIVLGSGKASLNLEAGGNKATLSGLDVTVDGTNTSTLNGNSKVTVNATGQTIISGAIVKLN